MRPCDVGRKRNGNPSRERTAAARERKRRWAAANRDPLKESARRQVRTAVEQGAIVVPDSCEKCGNPAKRHDGARGIQAHHFAGYNEPLAVQWLCPKCHSQCDAAMQGGGK